MAYEDEKLYGKRLAMLLLVGAFGSPALRTEAAGEETVRSEGTDGLYASGQEIRILRNG